MQIHGYYWLQMIRMMIIGFIEILDGLVTIFSFGLLWSNITMEFVCWFDEKYRDYLNRKKS